MGDVTDVTIVDEESFTVTESVDKTYNDADLDAEIAVLQANIVTYQERIDYLNSLKTTVDSTRAAAAAVSTEEVAPAEEVIP